MVKEMFFPAWVLVSSFGGIEICMARQKYIYKNVYVYTISELLTIYKQKYVPFFDLWNMGM